MLSLTEDDFFFALAIFVSQIRIFTNLGRFGECFGKVWGVFGMILENFWPDFLKFWETHHLCLEIAHYMRFKTIALQKWFNKNGLHPWKHVSHPWEQFCFLTYQRFDRFETPCFCIRFLPKMSFVASLKYKMPPKHYLCPQSGWRLAERSGNYLFGTSTIDLHVQRRLLSYQICSTITSQIIPRHLIADPAECAQHWNPPPPNGRAGRAKCQANHVTFH